MSQNFESLRAQFEAESNQPQRKKPNKSWVATPFTQISITTSQSKSQSVEMNNAPNSKPKPPLPPVDTVNIGDQIELTNGRLGTVRYVGNIEIKKGIWVGVELNDPSGNHDGALKGKRYFKTEPHHATFVKYKKIKRIIKPDKEQTKSTHSSPLHIDINSDSDTRSSPVMINPNKKRDTQQPTKRKSRKRSYFDSDDDPNDKNTNQNIDINLQDIDSYNGNNDIHIPSTPQSNNSELISPPPIPPEYDISNDTNEINESSDYLSDQDSGIDVANHTAAFDIESFNNIKEKLQRALSKTCIDTLNHSRMYDDALKRKKRYNKCKERLHGYVEGLMEYTQRMLNNTTLNMSEMAVQMDPPFNALPDAILEIDMYKYGHLCFHVTLKYIEILAFLEEIVWIPLQYIAMVLPSAIGIRLLFEMPAKIQIFPPLYINRVCKRVVEGSQYPIAVCLKIAEFALIVGQNATSYSVQYQQLHEYYTHIAIDILNDINSDHAALIVLECPTDLEPSTEPPLDCLTIAIRSNNGIFISNKRVMSILNGMWESSSFLEANNSKGLRDNFTTYDRVNFLLLLRHHYRSVPAMPCGKYAMQLLLFICEVVLLSWFALRRLTISSSFEFYEPMLWAFGLSSAAESVYMTMNNDRLFRMNIADVSSLLLGFNFGILAGIRFYYLLDVPSDATKQSTVYQDMMLTFESIYAVTVILAFLRVSTLFSMSERFGGLLIIVQRMTNDIQNFALLWILFVFGFVFAEYYYIAKYLDESFSHTFLDIFAVTTGGDADFEEYTSSDRISKSRSTIAQIMLVLLVLFGALLLINLFIAMMAKTFDEMSNISNTQWSLNAATFIVKYDRRNDILPPPFNLVVYILVLLWYIFEIPLVLCVRLNPIGTMEFSRKHVTLKEKLRALISGQHDVWLCEYCHSVQHVKPNDRRIKLVKKWMSVIGFDTRDRTAILESEAVLCQYCKRVKRTEKRYEWIADNISYCIAYVVILPIVVILTVPTGSIRILWHIMVDVERNDMEEFYRLFHEKQKHRAVDDKHQMRKWFIHKRISEMLDAKED
eukprot:202177_1